VQLTLTVPTLRDRVCMTAALLVLEPIFEADLPSEQYAYRPGRNAHRAAVEVKDGLYFGHTDVVDADLADYFGSVPHFELMLSLARRIVDRRVLHLIKMWLECAVEETDRFRAASCCGRLRDVVNHYDAHVGLSLTEQRKATWSSI
jgi:RNA-directed DNA polymerase